MHSLTIAGGEQNGAHFVLAGRPLSLGRSPSRDIQITDPRVSRRHALIRRVNNDHLIAPAKALNGVLINGRRIEAETALRSGDEITLGRTVLRYAESADPGRTNALHRRKIADRAAREHRTLM